MSTTILIKRGSEASRSTIVPMDGELILTSDQHRLFVGDGASSGGLSVTASLADTSSFYRVSNPTGQSYFGGSPSSSVSGIVSTDRAEDALNKLELILEKLAPSKPPLLSTKTLTMASSYTALRETAGTSTSNIFFGSNPVFVVSGVFADGDVGSLTASIDGVDVGSTTIVASSNVGTYGALQITNNDDFYAGVSGKSGFWRQLLAQINSTGQTTVGPHTASLTHSTTGTTPGFTYYIDDAVTPTSIAGQTSGSGFSYVSGVPALVGGQNGAKITFSATGSNTVARFYNSTRIFSVSGTGVNTSNFSLPVAATAISSSVQSASLNVNVNSGVNSTTPSYTITAYNSRNTTSTATATSNFRIDKTLDTTNRVISGQNQYPTTGYGSAWVSSQDLSSAGQEELQMLNGQYQYPTGNYTSYTPTGPDYSSLPAVTFGTVRWVTFSLGSQTNIQNVTITFTDPTGMGTSALVGSGWYLNVKAEGATGWVDGNAAYPGAGSPSTDGAAALDVANSNGTVKKVTFGSTPRSGVIYVRIGVASGQAYKFGSLSATFS